MRGRKGNDWGCTQEGVNENVTRENACKRKKEREKEGENETRK